VVSTVPRSPNESPGHFFADSYATKTVDALRHIDVDARVGLIDKLRLCCPAEFILQPVIPNRPLKVIRWTVREGLFRVVACQQANLRSAQMFDFCRMRENFHSVRHQGRARRDGP